MIVLIDLSRSSESGFHSTGKNIFGKFFEGKIFWKDFWAGILNKENRALVFLSWIAGEVKSSSYTII